MGALVVGGYWLFGPAGQVPTTTVAPQPATVADARKIGGPSYVVAATPPQPPPIVAPAETKAPPPPTEMHAGAPVEIQPPAATDGKAQAPAETQAAGPSDRQPQRPPSPAPLPAAADVRGPAPVAVATAPEPPAVAPVASSQASASANTGKPGVVFVQLASMTTEAGATAEWQRLQSRIPELLGNRQPDISKDEQHGRIWWRLRTGGFDQATQATDFCAHVRARGLNCFLTAADQAEADRAKAAR